MGTLVWVVLVFAVAIVAGSIAKRVPILGLVIGIVLTIAPFIVWFGNDEKTTDAGAKLIAFIVFIVPAALSFIIGAAMIGVSTRTLRGEDVDLLKLGAAMVEGVPYQAVVDEPAEPTAARFLLARWAKTLPSRDDALEAVAHDVGQRDARRSEGAKFEVAFLDRTPHIPLVGGGVALILDPVVYVLAPNGQSCDLFFGTTSMLVPTMAEAKARVADLESTAGGGAWKIFARLHV